MSEDTIYDDESRKYSSLIKKT